MDQPAQPQLQKKRHRLRTTLIILILLLVVLPILALGYTGVYQIPVVSALFGTNKASDLGVRPTAADLASAIRDNPMTFQGDAAAWSGMSKKKYSGSVPIDDVHSSAEITAFIQQYTQGGKYAKDIHVRVIDGGVELSAFVTPFIKAPVFARVGIVRTGPKSVALTLQSAKVGRLSVPEQYYPDIAKAAQDFVNARLAEVDGLSIDVLEYRNGEAYLKGILPKTVEQIPGEEYMIAGRDLRSL